MQTPQEMRVWSLGREDPLEEEMATYPIILAGGNPQGQWSVAGYSPWGQKGTVQTQRRNETWDSPSHLRKMILLLCTFSRIPGQQATLLLITKLAKGSLQTQTPEKYCEQMNRHFIAFCHNGFKCSTHIIRNRDFVFQLDVISVEVSVYTSAEYGSFLKVFIYLLAALSFSFGTQDLSHFYFLAAACRIFSCGMWTLIYSCGI